MASKKERNHYDLIEIENYCRTKTFPKRLAGKGGKKANFRQTAKRYSLKNGQLYYKESRLVIPVKDCQVDIIHVSSFWENPNIRKNYCTFLLVWDLQRCCEPHTKI